MRHRPTELREVVKLLEAEHDSVDDLAQRVMDLLVEIKWSRGAWISILRQPVEWRHEAGVPDFDAWGPYPTYKTAVNDTTKAAGRLHFTGPADDIGRYAFFAKVQTPDAWYGEMSEGIEQ